MRMGHPVLYAADSHDDYAAQDYLMKSGIRYSVGLPNEDDETPFLTCGCCTYYGLRSIRHFIDGADRCIFTKPMTVMSLSEANSLAKWFGADIRQIADVMGVSSDVIRRWESDVPVLGTIGIPEEQLESLVALKQLLLGAMPEKERIHWLNTSNDMLGGYSPLGAMQVGNIEHVHGLVLAVAEGTYF